VDVLSRYRLSCLSRSGSASRTVDQPVGPPPLPEVLRQYRLAETLTSAFTG
jgi:hypothetical protein